MVQGRRCLRWLRLHGMLLLVNPVCVWWRYPDLIPPGHALRLPEETHDENKTRLPGFCVSRRDHVLASPLVKRHGGRVPLRCSLNSAATGVGGEDRPQGRVERAPGRREARPRYERRSRSEHPVRGHDTRPGGHHTPRLLSVTCVQDPLDPATAEDATPPPSTPRRLCGSPANRGVFRLVLVVVGTEGEYKNSAVPSPARGQGEEGRVRVACGVLCVREVLVRQPGVFLCAQLVSSCRGCPCNCARGDSVFVSSWSTCDLSLRSGRSWHGGTSRFAELIPPYGLPLDAGARISPVLAIGTGL